MARGLLLPLLLAFLVATSSRTVHVVAVAAEAPSSPFTSPTAATGCHRKLDCGDADFAFSVLGPWRKTTNVVDEQDEPDYYRMSPGQIKGQD
ncbi:unnamed protein product [Alopecurus aequalis]